VWVKKWVDYTSKYGIGYCISNDAIGVYFNDQSSILSVSNVKFVYSDLKRKDPPIHATTEEYPSELHKKISILKHFRSHFERGRRESNDSDYTDLPVYIKRWVQTRHAIAFKLSNKTV